MNKRKRRYGVAVLILSMAAIVLTGCTNNPAPQTPSADAVATDIIRTIEALVTPTAVVSEATTTTPLEPTATAIPPTSAPIDGACTDRVAFVRDITIPDDTVLTPGAAFTKTWRVRNEGTCPWTADYALVFAGGTRFGAPQAVSIGQSVSPGESIDISVSMTAPTSSGTYQSNWQLRNNRGLIFGLGGSLNEAFWVRIIVGPTPTLDPDAWRGEYFSNRSLSGPAALYRYDSDINFNWHSSAPTNGIPANDFSVRLTRTVRFTDGVYRFRLLSDDGARLYVDGQLVLDQWTDGAARETGVDLHLRGGNHEINVEYYEHNGDARIKLDWEERSNPSWSEWQGEYWTNANFTSRWALVRNDPAINFDWGTGYPATGIPTDNFSVSWNRQMTFEPGTYRFTASADDGIRLAIDGGPIINQWHDSDGTMQYTADVYLNGSHRVQVEYYEHSSRAMVNVSWERLEPTATATATATASPTATATVTATATASPTPTATATATASPTPTATATGTVTITPTPMIVADFIETACSATWSTQAGSLPCPAPGPDDGGYVLQLDGGTLENGETTEDILLVTQPAWIEGGWIRGMYNPISIQAGDRLSLVVGCMDEQIGCQARFSIGYQTATGSIEQLLSRLEFDDGRLFDVEIPLDAFAGESILFVLQVDAVSPDSTGATVWVNAQILR